MFPARAKGLLQRLYQPAATRRSNKKSSAARCFFEKSMFNKFVNGATRLP